MHNFKNLTVWQKSIDLTTEIYSITTNFPADEKYGLTSQIRRAAVSRVLAENQTKNLSTKDAFRS